MDVRRLLPVTCRTTCYSNARPGPGRAPSGGPPGFGDRLPDTPRTSGESARHASSSPTSSMIRRTSGRRVSRGPAGRLRSAPRWFGARRGADDVPGRPAARSQPRDDGQHVIARGGERAAPGHGRMHRQQLEQLERVIRVAACALVQAGRALGRQRGILPGQVLRHEQRAGLRVQRRVPVAPGQLGRDVVEHAPRRGRLPSTPLTRITGALTSASSLSISAVLPTPGSPSTATTRAEPPLADSHAARKTASSSPRPTKTLPAARRSGPCDTASPSGPGIGRRCFASHPEDGPRYLHSPRKRPPARLRPKSRPG